MADAKARHRCRVRLAVLECRDEAVTLWPLKFIDLPYECGLVGEVGAQGLHGGKRQAGLRWEKLANHGSILKPGPVVAGTHSAGASLRGMGRARKTAVLAIAAALLALVATAAQAELTEQGDLFVRFRGGIAPNALPRTQLAPIAVSVAGTVKTLSGQRPPALRQIRIELNRSGRLDPTGLPVCHYNQLLAASPRQALGACRDALVGGGAYLAKTAFPEQETFPSQGHILAFNGVYEGHSAILAHIYGGDPVPITRIIVFHIHRTGGTFGTILTGKLSKAVNHYGYVVGIYLRLFRRYVFHGRQRSYLSAACTAPAGFLGAVFPFARASMAFADGRTLSSTLTRSCKVSG